MAKICWADVETTGFDPVKQDVIQLGIIIEIDNKIVDKKMLYCQPFHWDNISPKALEINNTTMEQIKDFPLPQEAYKEVVELFDKYINKYDKEDKFLLAGQNVKFDKKMMNGWFRKNENSYFYSYFHKDNMDLMFLSETLKANDLLRTPNIKLGTICDYYQIPLDAHDALNDIVATRECFLKGIGALKQIGYKIKRSDIIR